MEPGRCPNHGFDPNGESKDLTNVYYSSGEPGEDKGGFAHTGSIAH